jgi:hypothetical protein
MLKRISIALTAIVLISWAAACGSPSVDSTSPSVDSTSPSATPTASFDKYEGTWVQQAFGRGQQNEVPRLLVKKVGDQYAFSDPSGNEKLVMLATDRDASGRYTILAFQLSDHTLATVDGDALKLSLGKNTFAITVDGDKMTWVMTGADKPFTFTREATPR